MSQPQNVFKHSSGAELMEQEQTYNLWQNVINDILLQNPKLCTLKDRNTRQRLPLIEVELLSYTEEFPFELQCQAIYAEEIGDEEKLGKFKARYNKDFNITCYATKEAADTKAEHGKSLSPRTIQGKWESETGNSLHYVISPSGKEKISEELNSLTGYDRNLLIQKAFQQASLENSSSEIKRFLSILKANVENPDEIEVSDLYSRIVPINRSGRSGKVTLLLQPAVINTYNGNLSGKFSTLNAPPALIIQLGKMKDFKRAQHASTMQQMLKDKGIDVPDMIHLPTEIPGTGYFFSFQEVVAGKHTKLNQHHLKTLGRTLGKIHALDSENVINPPVSNVLPIKTTAESIRAARKDTMLREKAGRAIESSEDMLNSARHEIAGSGTPEQISLAAPQMYDELETSREKILFLRNERLKEKNYSSGWCQGDITPSNTLVFGGPDGRVVLIDFELTGNGYFIDELALTLYFHCANNKGELDPEFTKAFFSTYIEERAKGSQPLTQKEIASLPEHIKKLAERQAHPIWEMYRNAPEAEYREFVQRHKKLPRQMSAFMQPEKADDFCRNFLGHSIQKFERYKDDEHYPSSHWQGQIKTNTPSVLRRFP